MNLFGLVNKGLPLKNDRFCVVDSLLLSLINQNLVLLHAVQGD